MRIFWRCVFVLIAAVLVLLVTNATYQTYGSWSCLLNAPLGWILGSYAVELTEKVCRT